MCMTTQGHPMLNQQPLNLQCVHLVQCQSECHPVWIQAENHSISSGVAVKKKKKRKILQGTNPSQPSAPPPFLRFPQKSTSRYPHHHLVAAWIEMRVDGWWKMHVSWCTLFRHKRVVEKTQVWNGSKRFAILRRSALCCWITTASLVRPVALNLTELLLWRRVWFAPPQCLHGNNAQTLIYTDNKQRDEWSAMSPLVISIFTAGCGACSRFFFFIILFINIYKWTIGSLMKVRKNEPPLLRAFYRKTTTLRLFLNIFLLSSDWKNYDPV